MKKTALLMSTLCLLAGMASSVPLTLENAGFETGTTGAWVQDGSGPSGWVNEGGRNWILLTGGTEGSQYVFLDSLVQAPTTNGSRLAQYTDHTIQSGLTYNLTVDAKSSPSTGADVLLLGVVAYNGSSTNLVFEQEWSNGAGTFPKDDEWHDYTLSYTNSGSNVGDKLAVYAGFMRGGTTGYGHLDNIQLEAIPEPATLGLVAVFGAGVMFVRRKLKI
ncbi:MAG: PEP-CTERM sorting domain-containing protein [Verrucomicrobiota bacterium]